MLFGKPLEFWLAIIGATFYVASRDAEKTPALKRVGKLLASGLFAYVAGDDLAPFTRGSESLAAILIMIFGVIGLDIAVAIVTDRDLIRDIVKRKFGGNGDGK